MRLLQLAHRFAAIAGFLLLPAALAAAAVEVKEGDFKASDGIKIHYYTLGDKGPWVVLVHGFTGSGPGNWIANGIAPALAENHRVACIDCRNHGKSDWPSPGGSGSARDVVELMDHLKIEKAHIMGYSMGGGITGQLLSMIPERFITAGFGGSGLQEVDPEMRAKVPAEPTGTDPKNADASAQLRKERAADQSLHPEAPASNAKGGGKAKGVAKGGAKAGDKAAAKGGDKADSAKGTAAAAGRRPLPANLNDLHIPMIVINGEFDRPNGKSSRIAREVKDSKVVILPGKTHLTAIVVGFMPKEYLDETVKFINAHDPK